MEHDLRRLDALNIKVRESDVYPLILFSVEHIMTLSVPGVESREIGWLERAIWRVLAFEYKATDWSIKSIT